MKIRQLRCFATAAREKSLTRASELLNVSQPAVGMQIRALEEYCGLKLFKGHSRGINVTPAGRLLAKRAEEIVRLVDAIDAEIEQLRDSEVNTVRLGITPAIGRVLISSIMEQCSEQYPDVTMLFNQGFVDEIQSAWELGDLDLLFSHRTGKSPNVEATPLYVEQFHLIGNPEIIADMPNPLPMGMLAELPLVFDGRDISLRKMLTTELAREGLGMKDTIDSPTISIRRNYAVNKLRFCIAPYALFMSEIESGDCASVPIDNPAAKRLMCLVGPSRNDSDINVDGVRNIILKLVREHVSRGDFSWIDPDQVNDS